MRTTSLRSLALAGSLAIGLGLASGADAASKGRVKFDNLHSGPHGSNPSDWFDLTSSEMEFGEAGQCKVVVQTMLNEMGPYLVAHLDDMVDEVKIELLGGMGNQVYYRARLTEVHVTKVTSRTLWGSSFEDIELSPTQIRWERKVARPDGTFEQGGEMQVTCLTGR